MSAVLDLGTVSWDSSLMSGFDYDIKDSMKYDSYQNQDDRVIQGKQMSSISSRYQHFSSYTVHVFYFY